MQRSGQNIGGGGGGTTNLFTHMRRHHPLTLQGIRADHPQPQTSNHTGNLNPQPPTPSRMPDRNQTTLPGMIGAKCKSSSPRATSITKAVAYFIVKDLRPYSVVSNEGFKNLVKVLDPRYEVPARQTFSDTVFPDMYIQSKKLVKSTLAGATNVAITTDGWTSRATESYVTITSPHIDENWEMKNYVLQTRSFSGSHTGSNIAELLKAAVTEWNLPPDPPLVTENASNMLAAANEFGTSIHIGCYAHTLNLAAQKSLKIPAVDRLLGRIRRVVGFFHRSTIGAEILKKKIELLNLPDHKLIQDVCTRWNSAADMVERYLELQPAIYAAFTSGDMRKLCKDIVTLTDIY